MFSNSGLRFYMDCFIQFKSVRYRPANYWELIIFQFLHFYSLLKQYLCHWQTVLLNNYKIGEDLYCIKWGVEVLKLSPVGLRGQLSSISMIYCWYQLPELYLLCIYFSTGVDDAIQQRSNFEIHKSWLMVSTAFVRSRKIISASWNRTVYCKTKKPFEEAIDSIRHNSFVNSYQKNVNGEVWTFISE